MMKTLSCVALSLFCAALSWGQAESASLFAAENGDLPPAEVIRKDVQEVNLFFTARGRHGQIRTDLKFDDFKLRDNGRPPERISRFEAQTEVPLRVVLLLDISDSIAEKLKAEKMAALVFLQQVIRPEVDQVMFATFGDQVQLVQGFTGDLEQLKKSVGAVKGGGSTAFFDALAFAAIELGRTEAGVGRHIIIVISDGQDTSSTATEKKALAELLRSNAVVFALSTKGEFSGNALSVDIDEQGFIVLRRFARETGGTVVDAKNRKRLASAFAQIKQEIRSQYFVAYNPAGFAPDGSYRTIDLSGRGLRFYARKGYYAAASK